MTIEEDRKDHYQPFCEKNLFIWGGGGFITTVFFNFHFIFNGIISESMLISSDLCWQLQGRCDINVMCWDFCTSLFPFFPKDFVTVNVITVTVSKCLESIVTWLVREAISICYVLLLSDL